jgi:hypothetical protein
MKKRSDHSQQDLQMHGPLRRNAFLLVVAALGFVVGHYLGELLLDYRAIVLDVRADEMFVGFGPRKPPRWQSPPLGQAGDILVKKTGTMEVVAEKPTPQDAEMVLLFERYQSSYSGRVTAIEAPLHQGGPSVAIIQLTDGAPLRLPVWDEELASMIGVGRHVQKVPGSWDPKVVPAPASVVLDLVPGAAPAEPVSGETRP